jgi:hypothetical protein
VINDNDHISSIQRFVGHLTAMSQFAGAPESQSPGPAFEKREVAESTFEYLLAEVLAVGVSKTEAGNNLLQAERLDSMGYNVGYRWSF